jgi:hypothetical protein
LVPSTAELLGALASSVSWVLLDASIRSDYLWPKPVFSLPGVRSSPKNARMQEFFLGLEITGSVGTGKRGVTSERRMLIRLAPHRCDPFS